MTELPFNLPLILFLIFLVNYMTGAFFIVYHLSKFAIDAKTKTIMVVFLFGLAFLISFSFYFFFEIDWIETFKYLNI